MSICRYVCCTVTLTITADDEVDVYHNGVVVLTDDSWSTADTVTLTNACVLAVQGVYHRGGGDMGILASTSTGVVTDASWKCSAMGQRDWYLPGFDDATWSQARVIATNGDAPWGTVDAIDAQAKWIWTQGLTDANVYCRKTLC